MRRLLILSLNEKKGRALARTLGIVYSVEYYSLRMGAPRHALPDLVISIGTPLRCEADIETLQQGLRPFLANAIPVLCLLDKPTPREEIHARVIGVSMVMAQDSPSRLIGAAVRSLLGAPPRMTVAARQATMRTVAHEVGFALADLMNSAATVGVVDTALSDQAGRLLLSALDADGIADWMDTVSQIHDPTYHHCLLMAGIMATFVLRLGFKSDDCERLTQAAILHDIGKALIPVELINKAGKLTTEEMEIIRRHAAFGHDLLSVQGGHHPQVLSIVRSHHEYLDGTGYPDGLRGDEISDPVRIATICDVFTALVEQRSYKPSLPPSEAFVLLEQMGGKLDNSLLRAFQRVFTG
ncbi:HD domain-containing protein [Acetobacteraceae bacterium KSS8]|uniref:HD domain-containing protein n=1 Tax=Endosaccharibacter trunci TaxID=2812733 RepID=A0ABT1WAE8_9PROT|nr:HD domain-containing protein [Acetobacteraceae bacterium KSS8]